jgi:hypothetical protein
MGFNLNHISKEIVVGDISPASMQALLRDKWNVREHLSLAIISIYGGRVLQASNALIELCQRGSSYDYLCNFPSSFDNSLEIFMSQCEASIDLRSRVIPFLEQLAVEGFVPCCITDPLTMLAVKCNIAGFVSRKAETPWIANSVRGASASGVVPCLQSMRIVIAEQLQLTRRKQKEKYNGITISEIEEEAQREVQVNEGGLADPDKTIRLILREVQNDAEKKKCVEEVKAKVDDADITVLTGGSKPQRKKALTNRL